MDGEPPGTGSASSSRASGSLGAAPSAHYGSPCSYLLGIGGAQSVPPPTNRAHTRCGFPTDSLLRSAEAGGSFFFGASSPWPVSVKVVVCAAALRLRTARSRPGSTRSCRSDGGSDPPESACRGRLQTTLERHWLKTVVVSVEGKGASRWCVRYEPRRRAQANHRRGVETDSRHRNQRPQLPLGRAHREPADWMGGVRHRDGASSVQALWWNCGNSGP